MTDGTLSFRTSSTILGALGATWGICVGSERPQPGRSVDRGLALSVVDLDENFATVHTENSVHRFSTQCNIVTFRSPG